MHIGVKKNLFFVPYWILTVLERNSEPVQTVLDLEALSSVVSSEDLACIAVLNKNSSAYFGFSGDEYNYTYLSWTHQPKSHEKFHNNVEPLFPMVSRTLGVRLFSEVAKDSRYLTPFRIVDIDAGNLMVVIYPGHFGGQEGPANKQTLIRELLKLFYAYEGFDQMANRQLFERYVMQLI
jgi:hypothetical protein